MDSISPKCPFHSSDSIQEFDALDPKARENPWPFYDWFRESENRRVYKLPQEQVFYLVHRYEDVKKAFADNKRLSSKIIPTPKGLFIALMDGEEHRRMRSVLAPLFLPKNIENRIPQIERVISEVTRSFVRKSSADLLDEWAVPIPLKVLSLFLGIEPSEENIRKLHAQSLAINRAIFVTGGTGPRRKSRPNAKEKFFISLAILRNLPLFIRLGREIGGKGMKELAAMFRPENSAAEVPRPDFGQLPYGIRPFLELLIQMARLIKHSGLNKSYKLGEHVPSTLRESIQRGDATLAEMIMTGAFILFAGHETTTSLLSNCFAHLARNPNTFYKLKENPGDIASFVEEVLRYYTPIGRFLRRAREDITIGETTIPKGSILVLLSGAANTDPERFPSGCAFDPNRSNSHHHLSFGKGVHFCIGAQLARITARVALEQLLNQADSISIDESVAASLVTDRDNGVYRYETLGVKVVATDCE